MHHPRTLTTELDNLVLVRLGPEHDQPYFDAYSYSRTDIAVHDPSAWERYLTIEDVEYARVRPSNKDKYLLGIILEEDTFTGSINLTPDQKGGAEIGYWLDTRYTGNGYATFATRALAQYAHGKFFKVYSDIMKGNNPSAAVLRRSAFMPEGPQNDRIRFNYIHAIRDVVLPDTYDFQIEQR